ncbi:MAG: hypothetical protein PHQ23_00565 [Candidatus Wallbacteria bacterium]|nr:hypothetical protein [Candidatus Wallbacteria bacterium]
MFGKQIFLMLTMILVAGMAAETLAEGTISDAISRRMLLERKSQMLKAKSPDSPKFKDFSMRSDQFNSAVSKLIEAKKVLAAMTSLAGWDKLLSEWEGVLHKILPPLSRVNSDLREEKNLFNRFQFLTRDKEFARLRDEFIKASFAVAEQLKNGEDGQLQEQIQNLNGKKQRLFNIYRETERKIKRFSEELAKIKRDLSSGSSSEDREKGKQVQEVEKKLAAGEFRPVEDFLSRFRMPGKPEGRKELVSAGGEIDMVVRRLRLQLGFLARSAPEDISGLYREALQLLNETDRARLLSTLPRVRALMQQAIKGLETESGTGKDRVLEREIAAYEEELALYRQDESVSNRPLLQMFESRLKMLKNLKGGNATQLENAVSNLDSIRKQLSEKTSRTADPSALLDQLTAIRERIANMELSDAQAEEMQEAMERIKKSLRVGQLSLSDTLLKVLKRKVEKIK